MSFEDKVVIVTGGASGIGKAIVKMYAKEKAKVIIADKDKKKGIHLQDQCIQQSLRVNYQFIDVKIPKDILHLMEYVNKEYGKIDILINNAGVSRWKSPYDLSVEEWEEIIQTNLRSVFLCSREAAKFMRNNKKGSIVNIASTRAFMSEPHSEAYAASKGGIIALTHALSISLGEDHIQVNSISPGWIENEKYEDLKEIDHTQHPAKRVGRPEDVARACLFLTKDENDFITGENLVIDGGMTKKMIYEE